MHRPARPAIIGLLSVALLSPAVAHAAEHTAEAVDGPTPPTFVEEGAAAGIDHVYDGSWEYFTGGGVAVFDCDADQLPDLYFAGGAEPASLYRNAGVRGGPLLFDPVAADVVDMRDVTGAYPIDIDSDGIVDLAVLRRGENVLLRGLGDCRFERANELWGFEGDDDWTTAFSAKWDAAETFPTLALGDYLTVAEAGVTPICDESAIFRPAGDGGFAAPEVLSPGFCALSMLFSDWDRGGNRDLLVTNDRQYYRVTEGEDQLWRVRPGEEPTRYTRDDGWEKLNVFGMSIASADLTADGYPEYYISSMADNKLRTLVDGPERPRFGDVGLARGVNAAQPFAGGETLPSTAWHAEFDDVNNDARLDLYVAKGNVEAMSDHATEDPSNLFLGQADGTFVEGAPESGIVHFERTRGAALADLNLDGLLDLVEVNRSVPVKLWRNAGSGTAVAPAPMGRWLAVELEQDGPNRDGIGAWIEVRAESGVQAREVTIGGGHVSGGLGPTHFGLGPSDSAEIRVTWPDAAVGEWEPVAADQVVRVVRGQPGTTLLASAPPMTGRERLEAPAEAAEPELPPIASVDPASCVVSAEPDKSVARLWDEALLDAIRRDFPAPTIHARNLFHTSAAMWDAWAAYDPRADGVFVDEKAESDDPAAAREAAISFAAYRVLSHRYRDSVGAAQSIRQFDELMAALCYPTAQTDTSGSSPAALGNRIAEHVIRAGLTDGSLELEGYLATEYEPVNEPLIVAAPGASMDFPNRWQPLALKVSYTQNGQLLPVGPQRFIGPHWGFVGSFAMPDAGAHGVPIDPGPPPRLRDPVTDSDFKRSAVEVVSFSSLLDPRDGFVQDISPRQLGGNTLGSNDGTGYDRNPFTGEPYARNIVPRADFGRAVAEFWADGPHSETPPGHWNTLANVVTDGPGFERRIGGVGPELDPLEYDVKLYLALNAAVHDAAIAAWGAKGYYDSVRPISMIRWMGGLGQSSDPALPAYHPDGLPLIAGQVELISEDSAASGQRHEHLAAHIGQIAIRAWAGKPTDRGREIGGVDWIRAVEWVPYQLSTFVTPAFAGYVSGHSTFSRAAAEVLTAISGSPYFPGGLGSWTVPAGSLHFEEGPSEDIELQWATYYDAADQAGISRLYGGIHIAADDLQGRVLGAEVGKRAWAQAARHFDGTARE